MLEYWVRLGFNSKLFLVIGREVCREILLFLIVEVICGRIWEIVYRWRDNLLLKEVEENGSKGVLL